MKTVTLNTLKDGMIFKSKVGGRESNNKRKTISKNDKIEFLKKSNKEKGGTSVCWRKIGENDFYVSSWKDFKKEMDLFLDKQLIYFNSYSEMKEGNGLYSNSGVIGIYNLDKLELKTKEDNTKYPYIGAIFSPSLDENCKKITDSFDKQGIKYVVYNDYYVFVEGNDIDELEGVFADCSCGKSILSEDADSRFCMAIMKNMNYYIHDEKIKEKVFISKGFEQDLLFFSENDKGVIFNISGFEALDESDLEKKTIGKLIVNDDNNFLVTDPNRFGPYGNKAAIKEGVEFKLDDGEYEIVENYYDETLVALNICKTK